MTADAQPSWSDGSRGSPLPPDFELDVAGTSVRITHADRVLWPALGLTKAWLIRYYVDVARHLLPHLAEHPLTLHRFSNGVHAKHWYQTRAPAHPAWVRTVTFRPERSGKVFDVVIIDNLPGLVWAAQIAAIELHPYLGTASAIDVPAAAVFDLDPGPGADELSTPRTAIWVHEILERLGLRSLVKTSGQKGLHVIVPLNDTQGYDETKPFVRSVAELLVERHRADVTADMSRTARAGRVLVDWSQNDPGKSTVAPYSLRGLPVPTVSTPVTWSEVESAVVDRDPSILRFTVDESLERVERMGDLHAEVLTIHQRVPTSSSSWPAH